MGGVMKLFYLIRVDHRLIIYSYWIKWSIWQLKSAITYHSSPGSSWTSSSSFSSPFFSSYLPEVVHAEFSGERPGIRYSYLRHNRISSFRFLVKKRKWIFILKLEDSSILKALPYNILTIIYLSSPTDSRTAVLPRPQCRVWQTTRLAFHHSHSISGSRSLGCSCGS